MHLKRFWQFYKPLVDTLNSGDMGQAIKILEDMVAQEGPCYRWKQLVVRFMGAGGLLPDHLDAMMILGENNGLLKEYVVLKRKSLSNKNLG
jgi:hypothetical protein